MALASSAAFVPTASRHGTTSRQTLDAKLDSAVRAALDSGQTVPVVILGHTQLLERLHGLEQFERIHANDDRRKLRREVIADLKRIAAKEQSEF